MSALGTATSPTGLAVADNRPARRVAQPAPVWTGRLEFDLVNARGWRVDVVDVVVRIDSVTLWAENRTLAVMDRDRFRSWLIRRPNEPFGMDDVTWSVQDSITYIAVDGSIAYVVAAQTVTKLLEVI
jgi:hypothetical protein